MLPLCPWVNLEAMAMKGYSAPPKLQHYWSLNIRLFCIIIRTIVGGVSFFGRDAVGTFYCLSWLCHVTFIKGMIVCESRKYLSYALCFTSCAGDISLSQKDRNRSFLVGHSVSEGFAPLPFVLNVVAMALLLAEISIRPLVDKESNRKILSYISC